jgi:hypothetical protein
MKLLRVLLLAPLVFALTAFAALSPKDVQTLPPAKVEARLPKEHPSSYLQYSARLFHEDKKDDAVFWFYVGSIRYRFHLAATPNQDPSGDPALFGSLQSVIGRQINEYAGTDPTAWIAQIDRALKWDADTENGFTAKKKFSKELAHVRDGLGKLRSWIDSNREQIASERKKNGLPTKG